MRATSLSLWEPFGLRGSPFFQEELKPSERSDRPISLFVGRGEELKRLTRRVVSDTSSRTIVEGDAGVGKTSLVNRLKAEVSAHGVASHEHPIRISSDMDWMGFVREALRTLLRIRLANGRDNGEDRFWRSTVLLLEGGELRGGGASGFGFGVSVSRGMVAPRVPIDSLYEHLGEALARVKGETGGGVLLHVNNLENQAIETATELSILIRDLRDYLLLDGAHWVFVGMTGVEEAIFRRFDQVGGIFPSAEALEPLGPPQVAALLRGRYRHLKLAGRGLTQPIESSAVEGLYGLYRGDLRNFLRLLGEAAERLLGVGGVRPMRREEILHEMAPEYARRLQRSTSETDLGHLARVVAAGLPEHAFRVTDAARITGLTQGGASDLVQRLQAARCISLLRREGRSVYYRPVGQVLVGLAPPPGGTPRTNE
jgi:hypothetical protein